MYSHTTGDYAGLHAVVLVGYGVDKDAGDYWVVRNSWGADFGEDGYFKIAAGMDVNGCNFEGGLTAAEVA